MDMSLWPLFGPPCTCNLLSWELGEGTPLPSRLGGLRCVVSSPSGTRGRAPAGEKRFYCFLSVSERLSLQRFLKINVVYSRPLIEKNGFAQWVSSDPLRQLPR